MNRERILALADLIEQQPHTEIGAASGFNMEDFTHPCGTPACIAGWAAFMFDKEFEPGKTTMKYSEHAGMLLGLDYRKAADLFLLTPGIGLEEITPAHAATTLRHLAETGDVEWVIGGDA